MHVICDKCFRSAAFEELTIGLLGDQPVECAYCGRPGANATTHRLRGWDNVSAVTGAGAEALAMHEALGLCTGPDGLYGI